MEDRFVSKDIIRAVYSDDLNKLLVGLGIDRDFTEGKIKCKYCDTVISRLNLFALSPEKDGMSFVCDSPECTEKMMIDAAKDDEPDISVDIDETGNEEYAEQREEGKR